MAVAGSQSMTTDESKGPKLHIKSLTNSDIQEDPDEQIFDSNTKKTYKKGKLLGIGGFARVFEMTEMETEETFAVKVIPKSRLVKPEQKEKMSKEIQLHQTLDHNNVVKFCGYFEDDTNVYILLEYCSCRSLFQVLRKKRRLEEDEVRFFMRQLAKGVEYIHCDRNIVHRDLKLGNLLLSKDMVLKIADFGLATMIKNGETQITTVCGTPNYIAPEVLNVQGHSFPADIWSMGCILYALLVGQPPFESSTLKETYARINNNLYSVPDHVSFSARRLIDALLQKNPRMRPTASEILSHEFFTGTISKNTASLRNSIEQNRFGDKVTSNRSAPLVSDMGGKMQRLNQSLPILHLQWQPVSYFISQVTNVRMESDKQKSSTKFRITFKKKIINMFSRSKKKKCPLRIQKRLEECLKELPNEDSVGSQNTLKDDFAFVTKWMDFTNKFGFGYQLSDGTVGVVFIDGCSLKLSPDSKYLECKAPYGKKVTLLTQYIPEVLNARYTILQHFARYMEENLVEGCALPHPTRWKKRSSVHLDKWFRTNQAILMHLTNGTIQVNFSDHTKLVFDGSSSGRVLYIDPEKTITLHTFKELRKNGCQSTLHNRMQHAASVLRNFLEKEDF